MLDKHFTKIQGTLGRSYSILEHIYKEFFFYSELEGKVSRACLKFNFDKSKRYEVIVIDKKKMWFCDQDIVWVALCMHSCYEDS